MRRLHAVFLLAWSLVRSLVAAGLGWRRGLSAFFESYAPDRLQRLTIDQRKHLPQMGRCIACGLCNLGEGARMIQSRGAYIGIMDLMLASSRSMPDFDVAIRSFAAVPDERLAEMESLCPTRVPMRDIARFVRTKGAEIAEESSLPDDEATER